MGRRSGSGDKEGIKKYEKHGPKLFMFLDRDHGELLAIVGRECDAVQHEIGNPTRPRR